MLTEVAEEAEVGRCDALATWASARAARVRPGSVSVCLRCCAWLLTRRHTFSIWRVLLYLARQFRYFTPTAIAQCRVQQSNVSCSLVGVGRCVNAHRWSCPFAGLPGLPQPHRRVCAGFASCCSFLLPASMIQERVARSVIPRHEMRHPADTRPLTPIPASKISPSHLALHHQQHMQQHRRWGTQQRPRARWKP